MEVYLPGAQVDAICPSSFALCPLSFLGLGLGLGLGLQVGASGRKQRGAVGAVGGRKGSKGTQGGPVGARGRRGRMQWAQGTQRAQWAQGGAGRVARGWQKRGGIIYERFYPWSSATCIPGTSIGGLVNYMV